MKFYGLPYVFSHLLMVILGMSIYNLFLSSPHKQQRNLPRFKTSTVYLSLSKRMLLGNKLRAKSEVGFVVKRRKGRRCLLSLRGVHLHHERERRVMLSLSLHSAGVLLGYLQRGELQSLHALAEGSQTVQEECNQKRVVMYGSR